MGRVVEARQMIAAANHAEGAGTLSWGCLGAREVFELRRGGVSSGDKRMWVT